MAANSPGQQLNDLLVTRNFDPEALDARTGKPPLDDQGAPDPEAADMFTFDWVADSGKNYGTVVCLIGADNNFEVYFGDNLGRGMEFDDKADWYEFLDQLRNFAKRNLLRYDLQNLRRLKYTMAGMAAIKEGLFEGYYGNKKISYAGEPTQARLMIKHNRTLGENDARFRYVESLFIETAEGEVFKMPFKKLAGGRAMLEHVRHGGTPYDARGQHSVEIVEQINVLSQFRRAHQGRVFEGAAGELVAETTEYLNRLRHNLKAVSNDRGYTQYFESWSPADVSESDLIVEDLKSLFVETRIDPRIEQALPMLARIQKEAQAMKEAEIFESWANRIVEGTWALPETPEQQDELKMLMSQPLVAGADGMNATEQLYGLVGDDELFDIINDIAVDPDANIWDDERVQNRLEELGVYMVTPAEPAVAAPAAETPPVAENGPYDLPGKDYDRPGDVKRKQPSGEHNPYPYSKEEDDDYFREIFRKKREAKDQGMAEGDNLATFEEAQCNHTMEGEYCPEHGLAECGGMYETMDEGETVYADGLNRDDSYSHMGPERALDFTQADTSSGVLANIHMMYKMAQNGMGVSHYIQSLQKLEPSVVNGGDPRVQKPYKFIMDKARAGELKDPKMVMQVMDQASKMMGYDNIAQDTRESKHDDPMNHNAAITGSYYESKEGDAALARIKSLALLK